MLTCDQVLDEALTMGRVQHSNGDYLRLTANISPENSKALQRFVQQRRPRLVIEIGMAYGVSTLSILASLQEVKTGRLISIDPYIGWSTGRLVALHQIKRAGVEHLHEHIHEWSYAALPKLLAFT
jgi:predicted O-methyltransferase YrrM